MPNNYRKIFGDPTIYQKFALTENEILKLIDEFSVESAKATEADKKKFDGLVSFIDALLSDDILNSRALPRNRKIASILKEIEGLESTVSFSLPSTEGKRYGQKFSGERIGLWSVPRTSGALLDSLVEYLHPKRIIEIGTSAGYSTLWMADGLSRPKNENIIDTIDNFPPKLELARKYFKDAGMDDRIVAHEVDALTYLRLQPTESSELVFLDADKERYADYLVEIERILVNGGVIIADNVYDFGKSMRSFLDALKKSQKFLSHLIEVDNGLLIAQKFSQKPKTSSY